MRRENGRGDGQGPVRQARGAQPGDGPADDQHDGRLRCAAERRAHFEDGKEGQEGPLY